jgi:ClpP class serine protease
MATIHGLDRRKGLDLILHTPGGEVAATESLVEYLRAMFGRDIRAIVPHLALSAGTMIALSCREIVMGKHSRIGAIDPQRGPFAAHGIIAEFRRAREEILENPQMALVWQPILASYSPTLVGECQQAIEWSQEIVFRWLTSNMFRGDRDRNKKAERVVKALGEPRRTKSHARHISPARARSLGLKITPLEENQDLQDAVLSVHHACLQSIAETSAFKLIENQNGVAFVSSVQQVMQYPARGV